MAPAALTVGELGDESATIASWRSREKESNYKSAKNTKVTYEGHFTRKKNLWVQALTLWNDDPDSEICKDTAEMRRGECMKQYDKLEEALNNILFMGILTPHYQTELEK